MHAWAAVRAHRADGVRDAQASFSAAVVSILHHSCDVGPVLCEATRDTRRPPRSTIRTTRHGDRRLLHQGCGLAVSLSLRRRGATAACGAPFFFDEAKDIGSTGSVKKNKKYKVRRERN